jgi:hypothetical protein
MRQFRADARNALVPAPSTRSAAPHTASETDSELTESSICAPSRRAPNVDRTIAKSIESPRCFPGIVQPNTPNCTTMPALAQHSFPFCWRSVAAANYLYMCELLELLGPGISSKSACRRFSVCRLQLFQLSGCGFESGDMGAVEPILADRRCGDAWPPGITSDGSTRAD